MGELNWMLRRAPTARFGGTGCAQILAASTKPQSTALVQLKCSTDLFPTRGMLQQNCCPMFPSHSFPPEGISWHFPQSHPNFAEMQWWPTRMNHPRDVLQKASKAQAPSSSVLI